MARKAFRVEILVVILAWAALERAQAGEIEPLKNALISLLGKVSVQHVSKGGMDYFYPKAPKGKAKRVVFVERNIYKPNCTHTWAIGIDAKSGRVADVRPLEMSCPHGYPAKSKTFLSQYQGKGLADLKTLDGVDTIAKATGTCKLATDAVKKAITKFQKVKGQI